jgi:hypothetical protein
MPEWLWAAFWGTVAGSALLLGAATGVLVTLGKRTVASVMAFWERRVDFRAVVRPHGRRVPARRFRFNQCGLSRRRGDLPGRELVARAARATGNDPGTNSRRRRKLRGAEWPSP